MPVLPAHMKRLNEKMLKLVKGLTSADSLKQSGVGQNYADLNLTFEECSGDEQNNLVPPIRYYFF